jgi:3-deoxy-D-manno-octulosonate 8-phosphate phosphatase KdsC-like HAD superfamily phosphatase
MAITSPEGVPALAAHVHWVTKSCAGAGAVREIAERVLRMQGKWANVLGEAMMV